MEYIGPVKVDQVYRGKGGRRYIMGNNKYHRQRLIHPEDVPRMIRKAHINVVKKEK